MNYLNCNSDRNGWRWRLLVVIASVFAMLTVGSLPYTALLLVNNLKNGGGLSGGGALSGVDKNVMLPVLMFGHVTLLAALILLVKIVHNQSWKSVVNGGNSVRWSHFFFGFLVWGLFSAAGLIAGYCANPADFVLNFHPERFLVLFIVAAVMIPIQAASEEFLFRGYLAQGIAQLTGNRLCVWLIPAILFGLAHFPNPEVAEYGVGMMMTQYILMGLFLGLAAIMDGGIEIAMGIHAVNNLFIALFTTNDSNAFQTDAVFKVTTVYPLQDTIILCIAIPAALAIIAAKYRLKCNLKSSLRD